MGGPRHLWAGDWEQDSEEAARARGGALTGAEADVTEAPGSSRVGADPRASAVASQPSAVSSATPPSSSRAAAAGSRPGAPSAEKRRRPRPRLSASARRVMVILSAILLIVVAGAFGLSRLIGPDRTTASPSPAQPAWLGVQMGVLPAGAVVLTEVDAGGPAARAGLRTGDVITQIEGRPVAAPIDVTEAVAALRVGDSVEIQALRGSRTLVVRPRLTAQGVGSP